MIAVWLSMSRYTNIGYCTRSKWTILFTPSLFFRTDIPMILILQSPIIIRYIISHRNRNSLFVKKTMQFVGCNVIPWFIVNRLYGKSDGYLCPVYSINSSLFSLPTPSVSSRRAVAVLQIQIQTLTSRFTTITNTLPRVCDQLRANIKREKPEWLSPPGNGSWWL